MEAGLNLYTLRKSITTEKDLVETAIRLRDMGYSNVHNIGGIATYEGQIE